MSDGRQDGGTDVARAARNLSEHLPEALAPLARLAYNYRWSWRPETEALFRRIEPERWRRCGENPVRLLQEVDPWVLQRLTFDQEYLLEAHLRERELEGYLRARGHHRDPVAYMCAEFGIHRSLPFYAGGLGVLAGDFLKESSDQGVPTVGVGLFYREGSFHQHIDATGWQHEYWLTTDSDRLPAVLVTGRHGPLSVEVTIHGRTVAAHIWRIEVGATQLYLLDSDVPGNTPTDRWITSRLYVGNREIRLAQYALLGIGGVRALRAMGISPRILHLNEGHAALATLELLRERLKAGESLAAGTEHVRAATVFTTHTPVAAGNESFGEQEVRAVLPNLAEEVGVSWDDLTALGRVSPEDAGENLGLTPLALHMAGRANGVSELHGRVARSMWAGIWPGRAPEDVPITHVTNGVHMPTWMVPEWQDLLTKYVPGWHSAPADGSVWDGIDAIPDEEIWDVRCRLRATLAGIVRERSVSERLGRSEGVAYAESAGEMWDDQSLTLGFARRIATYKRLHLITSRPERALKLLMGNPSLQIVIAGRAHPQDDPAKATVRSLFAMNDLPGVGGRAVFLEEHDLGLAKQLVQGCDVWVNLPRRPHEASGTSGMKAVANGGLHISVLDGWWAEGYRPGLGWGIASTGAATPDAQDEQDADEFFDLLEAQVLPLFYERDARGLPRGWIAMMRASLRAFVPQYSTVRMLQEYARRMYPVGAVAPGAALRR